MSDTPPAPPGDNTPPPPPPTAAAPPPTQPAPGWWLASDGQWYPPQSAVGFTPPPPTAGPVPTVDGQATAAMWLGIAGLLLCWTFIGGLVLGVLAIVFGAISKGKEAKTGRSTAGIVMGILAIVLPFLLIISLQFLGDEADRLLRLHQPKQPQ